MSVYAIADLHLSLGSDKPMDVFPGWEGYVEKLEKNWRETVRDEDTVVIAGDVSWGLKIEETIEDFRFINSLPGKKILIKGNHDCWWSTMTKFNKFLEENHFDSIRAVFNNAYEVEDIAVCGSRGWLYNSETPEDKKVVAREAGRVEMSIQAALKTGKKPYVFLHYPPIYDEAVCVEIVTVLKRYKIEECWFGHIHGTIAARKAMLKSYGGFNLHLISADYVGFRPVLVK